MSEINPYEPPKIIETNQIPENGRFHYAIAGICFPIAHLSSVFLPISLWSPQAAFNFLTLGLIPVTIGKQVPAPIIWSGLLVANIISILGILLLLYRWKHRSKLFYLAAMGLTITFLFCTFSGAVWNLALAILFWVLFGKNTHEFFGRQQ